MSSEPAKLEYLINVKRNEYRISEHFFTYGNPEHMSNNENWNIRYISPWCVPNNGCLISMANVVCTSLNRQIKYKGLDGNREV